VASAPAKLISLCFITYMADDNSAKIMRMLNRFRCIRVLKYPRTLSVCVATVLGAGTADAIMVDLLQPNSTGSLTTLYGTAIFTTDTTQPTGTGVFDPFLTIQNNGVEQGYNSSSSSAPFDVKRIPQWNHEFTVAEMKAKASVTIDGKNYYRFLIDINEPNAGDKPLISLDSLKLFTTTTAGQTTTNVESLGVKRFDMDLNAGGSLVDNWVAYDDRNHGSGQSDVAFMIPTSAFASAADSDYVYMYQKFGEHQAADDFPTGQTEGGFEETKFGGGPASAPPPVVIPEPFTAIPLVGMLMVVMASPNRRARRASRVE
jgi:hypothetical protein